MSTRSGRHACVRAQLASFGHETNEPLRRVQVPPESTSRLVGAQPLSLFVCLFRARRQASIIFSSAFAVDRIMRLSQHKSGLRKMEKRQKRSNFRARNDRDSDTEPEASKRQLPSLLTDLASEPAGRQRDRAA